MLNFPVVRKEGWKWWAGNAAGRCQAIQDRWCT